MNIVVLTRVTGFLKPFAWIMGIILNAIYELFSSLGITNIALCIFIFTFVIKMLMLPLTVKQQKQTRLQSKMAPEIKKIQERYKGKKDEVSLRNMQAETNEVYAKYGTSQFAGCLPLLITFPIMIALYRVIYSIPAYVGDIGDLYNQIAVAIQSISGHADAITTFVADNAIKISENNLSTFALGSTEYTNNLIDILVKFTSDNWAALFATDMFAGLQASLQPVVDQIMSANMLFGLNILDSPSLTHFSWAWLVPVLAVVTQYVQGKLQSVSSQTDKKADDPAAATAKSMTTIMPIMSGAFCFMFPIGVGVYWIASAFFTILQTLCINKYLDGADLDEMIAKNVEKANKKRARLGIDYGNKMAEVAKTTTRTYTNTYAATDYDNTGYKKNNKRKTVSGQDYKRSTVSYSASSIAANANLLAARNSSDSSDAAEKSSSQAEEGNN